jgi:hypothetical protein
MMVTAMNIHDGVYKYSTGRLRVLYTDYDYALMFECTEESPDNGKCHPRNAHAILYSRRKQNGAQLPDDVREKVEVAANEACLYLEDFVPATLPKGAVEICVHTS